MTKRDMALAAAVCLAAAAASAGARAAGEPQFGQAAPSIRWVTNHKKAMEEAHRAGKPVLIDFWATWCGPCKMMESDFWSRSDVIKLSEKFVCLRVDVDKDLTTAPRYRAESLPTVVYTDPWGTVLASRRGYGGADEYAALMGAIPADFSSVAPFRERLAANPRDLEALRQTGLAYQKMKLYDTSNEFFDKLLGSRESKDKPAWRAEALTTMGWNYLKVREPRLARKSFERCMKDFPEHPALDVTLYGLLALNLVEGRREEANPFLARLESCCPSSDFTARARKDLSSAVAEAN